ncbi:MAG: hypothetical protein ACO1O6_05200 [Bacteroidota bacterium]
MAKNHHINLDFQNSEAEVKANIVLISFKEGDSHIVYSPHFDVSGYGLTEEEALKSFNYSVGVFLDYTVKKKTLHKVLSSLGWELIKGSVKKPKKIHAPSWKELIQKNDFLEDLLSRHNIRTSHQEVAIPF